MLQSRLPEDIISDYVFIEQFFAAMHPRLHQDAEVQYNRKEDINEVIAMVERIDSIHRGTGAYGMDNYSKQTNTTKKPERKAKKQFNIKTKMLPRKNKRRRPVSPVVVMDMCHGIVQTRMTKKKRSYSKEGGDLQPSGTRERI